MSGYLEQIATVAGLARQQIAGAEDLEQLEQLRLAYLGRKGKITAILHDLGQVPPQERPQVGKQANELKEEIGRLLESRRAKLEKEQLEHAGERGALDVTLPGLRPWTGSIHPLNRTLYRVNEVLYSMGFSLAEGPEIEDEFHNFDALNTPADHPARDEQDTFFLEGGLLLRSHTSPVQIRHMLANPPPVRIIAPGRVFRRDAPDATHSPIFHQVEGLYVAENVTFGDLKYTLEQFALSLFGPETLVRFRPSFFPFTEPSAEVDCSCIFCKSKGCRFCKGSGWLEILGCGMVDPNVFEAVGYDPERWTGFAFGMGIDRICLLVHGIDDIRLLLESDTGFLSQF